MNSQFQNLNMIGQFSMYSLIKLTHWQVIREREISFIVFNDYNRFQLIMKCLLRFGITWTSFGINFVTISGLQQFNL